MNDMTKVIVPRSDQLNSDDLIIGPRTITITGVTIRSGEQPVSISFDGDDGKPYKPCKGMCRVMVNAWGGDSKQYVGRSMTLFREPTVKWGGLEVGGIQISHMTDIKAPLTMALTATRGSRKPFTVKPLKTESAGHVGNAAPSGADSTEQRVPADLPRTGPMTDDSIAAEVAVLVGNGSYDLALDLARGMTNEDRKKAAVARITEKMPKREG